MNAAELLAQCDFPPSGTPVDLAVSGGPDSVGLLLLALDAELVVRVHHVDHHARKTSGRDAAFVAQLAHTLDVPCTVHDVLVPTGSNFEGRARMERRRVLPEGALTGHTMDDAAETFIMHLLRGAGIDGLSAMTATTTMPLRRVRRQALHQYVAARHIQPVVDESNADPRFTRNRVRAELLPLMNDILQRDVVPIVSREAGIIRAERDWLDALAEADADLRLEEADCRTLSQWPEARLRRWLRRELTATSETGDAYPPSIDELERASRVVRGAVVACELVGGRRLSRRDQRLTLRD